MLFAGVWTLLRLIKPVAKGLMLSISGLKSQSLGAAGLKGLTPTYHLSWYHGVSLLLQLYFIFF